MEHRQDVPWVHFVSRILAYQFPASIIGVGLLGLSVYAAIWTLSESFGLRGSARTAIGLLAVSIAVVGIMLIGLRFLRWTFLFAAVKEYVRRNELHRLIDADTVLVSGGAGGALAVGMVSKALQELGHPLPHSFVIDCQYRGGEGRPQTGVLLPAGLSLADRKCFVIHSYIGTGRSLECVREVLGIPDAPVFSFVVSEALVGREDINHYLVIGERAIVPWPKSSS